MRAPRWTYYFLAASLIGGCKLEFEAGSNGSIIETALGFECLGSCTFEPPENFLATYTAVPKRHYHFSGWAGSGCRSPNRRLNPDCPILVNPDVAAWEGTMTLEAHFTRKANVAAIENTSEFEITNFGFGGFYTREVPPVTCYPTPEDCADGDRASWISPSNYQRGDFNNDGFQDLVIQPYMNNHYIAKTQKPGPVIYLNDKKGGLYRSENIFADGKSKDMLFGYRMAVADLNGDGVDDLVVGPFGILSREPDSYYEYFPERIALYLSGKNGKLHDSSHLIAGQEDGQLIPDMAFAHDLAVGDIDGDGDLDLYLAQQMLLNDGDGNFSAGVNLANRGEYISFVMSSLIADFDGDGIGDLVINYGESQRGVESWLYLSAHKSDLLSRQGVQLPTGYFGLWNTKRNHAATADLDGDGDMDIVVGQTRVNPYYEGRALQLLINDGAGNFTDETASRLGEQTDYTEGLTANQGEGYVDLLDLNADGHIDIFDSRGIFPRSSDTEPLSAGASIWLNDGDGNFVDVPASVFPFVGPRDMAPRYGDSTLFGSLLPAAPIDLDGINGIDLVSYVETNAYPFWNFGESTLYTLTSRGLLKASDYAD